MSPMVARVCRRCDYKFMVSAHRLREPNGGSFCSHECSSAHARQFNTHPPQRGAANPNWKGGVSKDGYRYKKRFAEKSPEKVAVHRIIREALKSGLMVRPEFCSKCRKACKAHAHHDDYTKPYDVRWLCQQCHNAHHAELRRQQKRTAA